MSPRNEKQNREVRERSMSKIEASALDLFGRYGFEGTSIDRIAKKAGVSKGLLYNYYEGKEDLLKKIVRHGFEQYIDFFKELAKIDDPFVAIENLIKESFSMYEKNKEGLNIYYTVILQKRVRKMAGELMFEIMGEIFSIVMILFEKMGAKDPLLEARMFGAVTDGIGIQMIVDSENTPVNEMVDYYLDGLKMRYGN